MLLADVALARRIDRTEIDFCAVAARAGEPNGAASLDVAGGRALCGAAGMPFNKALALGLGHEVSDVDLDRLEAFYASRGVPAQIELCPLATTGLASRLIARGFVLQGFENQLARVLDPEPLRGALPDARPDVPSGGLPDPAGVSVRVAGPEEDDLWLQIVSGGFAVGDKTIEAVAAGEPAKAAVDEPAPVEGAPVAGIGPSVTDIMRAFMHPDIVNVIASTDGTPASAGAYAVKDGVLFIFGTATLPRFRRRGAQAALVAHVVRSAGHADLAIASVEPGSVSQRVFERLGFQVVYTRLVLVKP
jgi:ribosomal protein S18 acetylase RimI-like enzyme